MATVNEIATPSVYQMFSFVPCLFVVLVISHFRFEDRILVLVVRVPDHYLPLRKHAHAIYCHHAIIRDLYCHGYKNDYFQMKTCDIFLSFAS